MFWLSYIRLGANEVSTIWLASGLGLLRSRNICSAPENSFVWFEDVSTVGNLILFHNKHVLRLWATISLRLTRPDQRDRVWCSLLGVSREIETNPRMPFRTWRSYFWGGLNWPGNAERLLTSLDCSQGARPRIMAAMPQSRQKTSLSFPLSPWCCPSIWHTQKKLAKSQTLWPPSLQLVNHNGEKKSRLRNNIGQLS